MSASAADSAAAAFVEALEMLAETLPGSHHETGPRGTLLVVTHAMIPALNPVISAARQADAQEIAALAATAARITDGKVPWSIRLRGEPDEEIVEIARRHGLDNSAQQPFMLKSLGENERLAAEDRGVPVRRLRGDEFEIFARVLGETFGVPSGIVSAVYRPEVLDAPDIRAYVAEVDGTAVSAAVSFRTGAFLGLGNVSTPPAFRRRGYARALSAAIVDDGLRHGASTVYLHSTDEAVPLFEGLGFTTAEPWVTLSAS